MAAEIGVVNVLMGTVTAFSTDGSLRILNVGDNAYANDLILTGPDAAIEIRFADGSVMDLGRDSQLLLNVDFFELNLPDLADDDLLSVSILVDAEGDDILTGNDAVQSTSNQANGLMPIQYDIAGFAQSQVNVLELADVVGNPDNHIAGVEYEGHLQIQVSNAGGLIQLINVTDMAASDDMAAQSLLNQLLNSDDSSDFC